MAEDYVPRGEDPELPEPPQPESLEAESQETGDAGDVGPMGEPSLRSVTEVKKPSTLGGLVYLCVLAAALIGIGIASTGRWRTGVSWLAVSLIGAAVGRLVLPDDKAGMLRVRRKSLDAAILIGLGAALLFLAGTIPDQPR